MDSIQLKIQERAFPSKGRARLHESLLEKLGVTEGDELELYWNVEGKPVVVAVFGDALVDEGHIRLSTEDIASLGVPAGTLITVKKRPPLTDRMKKSASDTAEDVKSAVSKAPDSIKEGAHAASESIKGGATAAKESIEKGAETVAKKIVPDKSDKDL
jgi:hypothetical protein